MMNRIAFNTIVRAARINPAIRSAAPYRWQSSKTNTTNTSTAVPQQAQGQGSSFAAGAAGGLAVLLGGFAWYHFSGTRQVVNAARDTLNKAQEIKDKVKDKAGDAVEGAAGTINYLRSATATLIPGSAPFLGKIFDQIEQISKEHGDDVKQIFDDTYKDFEKLAKEGGMDTQTAGKAVEILQKRVKELQELAGEKGGDVFNKLISDNPKLKDQISDQYNKLKEIADKAKDKKPEVEKLFKDTTSELTKIFKDGNVSKESVQKAQDLLKKKADEAKKIGEDVVKDTKDKKGSKDDKDDKDDNDEKGGDAFSKLISGNPKLKDQISDQYNKLKEIADKAKDKKPEVEKLFKDTTSELTKIFKDGNISKESIQKAQDLLKKKADEARKIGEDVVKDAKDKKGSKDENDDKKKK